MRTEILDQIEQHLLVSGTSASRFGRAVVGDPRFVEDLRGGRVPREPTEIKVHSYLSRVAGSAR